MPILYRKMFVMWPPRPEGSSSPDELSKFPGWSAQRKFNGTRTLVFIDPDLNVHLRTRHREEHRAYQLTDAMETSLKGLLQFRGFSPGKWHVFDGELMHNKTTNVKDRFVLFDVLVHDGMYLTGTTMAERYAILMQGCGTPTKHEEETGRSVALKVNQNVWLVETFYPKGEVEFRALFDELLDMDEIEGLVLKDPGGKLKFGVSEANNSAWLIRVRKHHKNYRH